MDLILFPINYLKCKITLINTSVSFTETLVLRIRNSI